MSRRRTARSTAAPRAAVPPPPAAPDRRSILLTVAGLVALTLFIYAPVRSFDFVTYDDLEFVVENPAIATGLSWQNVRWSWANAYWSTGGPLTWLSHMVDVEFFGLDAGGHHLTSVLLHLANTLLLFGVLLRMTNRFAASAMVAALFAVHPLHVESVAWVSQRKDVLSTSFWLLAMWAYAGYARRPRATTYLAVTVTLAMGLLSKPMVATLPFVLLLLDAWPLRRLDVTQRSTLASAAGRLIVEKLPWIGMAVVSLLFTLQSQQSGGSVPGFQQLPLATRLSNAVVSYVMYLVRFIWPADLTPHYPYDLSLSAALVCTCAITLVVISLAAWRWRRELPAFGVGWAWYLGTLVPVIGIVQVGTHAMADRFTYIPSIGITIAGTWLLAAAAVRWRVPAVITATVAIASVLVLGVAARAQVGIWRDGLTLWQHAARVSPGDSRAPLNLGVTLSRQRRFADAIAAYREAIRLTPDLPHAHNNLGLALSATGQPGPAIAAFEDAVRLDPEYAAAHANLADLMAAHGGGAEALRHYERAIQLDARAGLPRINYAVTLAQMGRVADALPHAMAAVDLDQSRTDWRFVTAMLLKELGRRDDAVRELKIVLAQQPAHPHAQRELTALCGTACR